MNSQEKFYWLFGGILALLVLASAIGWFLQRRTPDNATIANLTARVRAWWVMVAIIAVNFVLGTNATVVLFAIASAFALREFVTLTPTRPGDHLPLVVCFYVLLPVQYWLIADGWYNLFAVFLPGLAALGMPLPLGGTSNHFRTDTLRRIGGWDAYNVTEDADLGIRLARFGYRSVTIPSVTLEEAPIAFGAWLRQ